MSAPLVSVIIPAYNAAPWIGASIRSVTEQTTTDLEVIVVNDGSTDATGALARSFPDPRVRILDQANAGVSAARNAGIRAARGSFISFLDADDAMLPSNLETKLSALNRESVDWVYGDLMPCDGDLVPSGEVMKGTDGDVVRTILLGMETAVPAPCSNLVARHECFSNGLELDEQLSNAADQDLALRLANAFSHFHVPQALTLYRVLPGSMSRNIALYEKDHLFLFNKAIRTGFLNDQELRRTCLANANWSIAGSWWVNARKWYRALPFLIRAIWLRPSLILRPLRNRDR